MTTDITRSSGNIFEDLGLPNPEQRMRKARVAMLIEQLIEKHGLSQADAAKRMGFSQGDVSRVVRGQLKNYSLERLLDGVEALGSTAELTIKDEAGRVLMTA
jgi:predicted XRE-type DNA-binding protein